MQEVQETSSSFAIDLLYGVIYSFLGVVFGYLFYHRVIDYYLAKIHYGKQPIVWSTSGLWGSYPFIGNLPAILYILWYKSKNKLPNHPVDIYCKLFFDKIPAVMQAFYTGGCCVLIGDPKVTEAMYTTKNSYFSKHPIVKDLEHCLVGDSILFAETSLEWKQARKTISPAFYKGKLLSLIELAR